jgi:hypothetical protein
MAKSGIVFVFSFVLRQSFQAIPETNTTLNSAPTLCVFAENLSCNTLSRFLAEKRSNMSII